MQVLLEGKWDDDYAWILSELKNKLVFRFELASDTVVYARRLNGLKNKLVYNFNSDSHPV